MAARFRDSTLVSSTNDKSCRNGEGQTQPIEELPSDAKR